MMLEKLVPQWENEDLQKRIDRILKISNVDALGKLILTDLESYFGLDCVKVFFKGQSKGKDFRIYSREEAAQNIPAGYEKRIKQRKNSVIRIKDKCLFPLGLDNKLLGWIETSKPQKISNELKVYLYTSKHLLMQLYEKEKLQELSSTNGLTGLFNYRVFDKSLELLFNEAVSDKKELSLIMMDIDNFKALNSNYGWFRTNNILEELGKLLNYQSRKKDIVCRFGGDEFSIILPETQGEKAKLTAEDLRRSIESSLFLNGEARITMSSGVADYTSGLRLKNLKENAGLALAEAKKTKNTVCYYDNSTNRVYIFK